MKDPFDLSTSDLVDQLRVPLLKPSKFAELVGLPANTVTNMMDRGELPVTRLAPPIEGKRPRRFINLVALFNQCEQESKLWNS